jgi:hypothetical protein
MCKQLLDILHPLNILGARAKNFTFDTSGTDIIDDKYTFNIEWEGRSLQVLYTMHRYSRAIPHSIDKYEQIKHLFVGGGTDIIEQPAFFRSPGSYYDIDKDIIYLKCVSVTKLIINGTTII